jgi:outer membrane protein OmpA-like peptidoglycan-associated protein
MKKFVVSLILMIAILSSIIAQDDEEGGKDPALFTRMPNHYISSFTDHEFDSYEFPVGQDKKQAVEGHYINVNYNSKENTQLPSGLQIIRNYTNAIKKIGGQIVFEFVDGGYQNTTMKLVKDGKEVWAHVYAAGNGMYSIFVVEKQAMEQDVVADANSMANTIKETGKVALYGIYFDTGKATLKPESESALKEIAKLVKADPGLKLYVVGHTDNTGGFDANMKLSMDRATAVVNELVSKYSVNASVLKACGDGPTAPVATNATEEGKALNRRVELVKQ